MKNTVGLSLRGKRVYLPTTVANGCILDVSVTDSASPEALTQGYREFQQVALQLDPNYAPISINHDGWLATQLAMRALFPTVTLILCFLHAVLKIALLPSGGCSFRIVKVASRCPCPLRLDTVTVKVPATGAWAIATLSNLLGWSTVRLRHTLRRTWTPLPLGRAISS